MDYKNTIITPKTDFPMRAQACHEPGMLEHWNKIDVCRLMLKRTRASLRSFCTTALRSPTAISTWATRSIRRSRTSSSAPMRCAAITRPMFPGWDNHGMPIESAIIKKNKLNHKAMPIPEFRNACQAFAQTSSTVR